MGEIVTLQPDGEKRTTHLPNISAGRIATSEGVLTHRPCGKSAFIAQRFVYKRGYDRSGFRRTVRIGKPFCCKCGNAMGRKALKAFKSRNPSGFQLCYDTYHTGLKISSGWLVEEPVQVLAYRKAAISYVFGPAPS